MADSSSSAGPPAFEESSGKEDRVVQEGRVLMAASPSSSAPPGFEESSGREGRVTQEGRVPMAGSSSSAGPPGFGESNGAEGRVAQEGRVLMLASSSAASLGIGESSGAEGRPDQEGKVLMAASSSSSAAPPGFGESSGAEGRVNQEGKVLMAASSSCVAPPGFGESSGGEGRVAQVGNSWYVSKKDIEENTPSRRDGIDLKTETDLRMYYSTFLQHLGRMLLLPQETVIATAMLFCHRFFLRQSHAKNDWRLVATACMFLATKGENNALTSDLVVRQAYEVTRQKDPHIFQGMNPQEVYKQQEELIVVAEWLVLKTLNFDLEVYHPYDLLVNIAGQFNPNIDSDVLCPVAWNFVNDGLRTSLCLQYKPIQFAACAIVLALSLIKLKLLIDGEKGWWLKFDVTTPQLIEFCDQMCILYEERKEGSRPFTQAQLRTGRKHPPVFNHWTGSSPANQERAAMKNCLIEKARELRASLLSDKNVVPLLPLKSREDEEANKIFDKHQAARVTEDRKKAVIEERKKAHGAGKEVKPLPPSKRGRGSGKGRGRSPGRGRAS